MQPRIYIYKITFEEVPYYYYGVKKEEYYNQEYWGSPKTNKWCWELYTPKKQILQVFPYTDEGWLEAQEVETRLIRSFYQIDKWCLNENCGGKMSLKTLSQGGKKGGKVSGNISKQNKTGIHAMTSIEKVELGKIGGNKSYEMKVGVHDRTEEQMVLDAKKGGNKTKELNIGFHGRTEEQMTNDGRKGGHISKQNKTGIHARSLDQMIEHGRKTISQRWMCLETGYITNPASLTNYQRKRGIETSKRVRVS